MVVLAGADPAAARGAPLRARAGGQHRLPELDSTPRCQRGRRDCGGDVDHQSTELLARGRIGTALRTKERTEMSDEVERRLKREDLFKLAAAAGGASLFASRTGVAKAAFERLTAESGRLQVLDWAGYGNDGGQSMFAQYVKTHAADKPQFTYMTNESDALAKLHAGLKPDIFRPYVGWVKYFATSGLVEPWDTSLISNFKHLNRSWSRPASTTASSTAFPRTGASTRSSTGPTR